MPSKSLKWRLLKRRRQSETREAKKKERRIGSMIRLAEFIHFRLGADIMKSATDSSTAGSGASKPNSALQAASFFVL